MKFKLWLLCCVLMLNQVVAQADDIYLEGISSVGKQRIAYIFVNKTKFSLKEGENLTHWKVMRIGKRSIVLADIKGNETELVLHNRLPPEPLDGVMPVAAMSAENPAATQSKSDTKSESKSESKAEKSHETQPSEEVPPGYRKVQTPFGEVIVKDDKLGESAPATVGEKAEVNSSQTAELDAKSITSTSPSSEDESKKEPEVRPGYHKVRTPFGDIWIEDKAPEKVDAAPTETLPVTK
jgi:hypothetical protein